MEYLVSREQMKAYDTYTIKELGIPALVLMERAAAAAAEEIRVRLLKRMDKEAGKISILVAAGCGNNGGDGFAAGRILQEYGYEVTYVLVGKRDRCTEETKRQIHILEKMGNHILEELPQKKYDVIVDAIFGIGLSREVTGIYQDAIRYINEAGAYVAAMDIPSGICADTGAVMGSGVRADLTVAFGYQKLGHVFYPGADHAGEVVCKKIGITWRDGLIRPAAFAYHRKDLSYLPVRKKDGNKGSFGKVLVVAGSRRMYGACALAVLGAYRSGAGLVRAFTAEENKALLMQNVPEALVDTYTEFKKEKKEIQKAELAAKLQEAIDWADCIVAGPGIGRDETAEFLMQYIWEHAQSPLIVDADGLNILAEHEEWFLTGAVKNAPFVCLTPHVGELARLMKKSIKCCKEDFFPAAGEYARAHRVILAAKDARTLVASPDGQMYVNLSGDNGMATGGSGDVLAGIMAGLAAQGMKGMEAACMAVFLHGLAGNAASKRKTAYCVMAGDLLKELPELFAEGEKNR